MSLKSSSGKNAAKRGDPATGSLYWFLDGPANPSNLTAAQSFALSLVLLMVENLIKFISNPLPFSCRVPVLHRYRKVQFGFLLHEEIAHSISFFVKQLSFSSVLINSPFEASLFWIKVFSVWTSNLEYFGIGHLKTTKRPPPVGPTHYPSEETQFFSFSFSFFFLDACVNSRFTFYRKSRFTFYRKFRFWSGTEEALSYSLEREGKTKKTTFLHNLKSLGCLSSRILGKRFFSFEVEAKIATIFLTWDMMLYQLYLWRLSNLILSHSKLLGCLIWFSKSANQVKS